MHPVGIEFGLKHNLIQLRGDGIVLSDQFLAHMSTAARRQLHGKRIDGSDLLEDVIDRGLGKMNLDIDGPPGPSRAFFAKIDIVVFDTMYLYAERARIGYRTGRTFFFTREFGKELYARKNVLRRAGEVMLAVTDPSDEAPAPRTPGWAGESGRGLQIVGALSYVWGWSPIEGHGKAVWAVLRCS